MAPFGREFSPKRFTQPGLFASLILRHVLKTTHRGFIEQISLMQRLRQAIGLEALPRCTTPQKLSVRADVLDAVDCASKRSPRCARATNVTRRPSIRPGGDNKR
jgi:hypothetical protein